MILADTSVWIDHFRYGHDELTRMLGRNVVSIHPFSIGELACGNLSQRSRILGLLKNLPMAPQAGHDEVLYFIQEHRLVGRGIGWVDAHLLASARLDPSIRLWTLDKRLGDLAAEIGISRES